jgi:hypothetical protein
MTGKTMEKSWEVHGNMPEHQPEMEVCHGKIVDGSRSVGHCL